VWNTRPIMERILYLYAAYKHKMVMLYHFAGPHSEKMKEFNYGKVRYFMPIKMK
jgi:hypothetical protein